MAVSISGTSTSAPAAPVDIDLGEGRHVAGLLQRPDGASACYVLAHGAGAGMTHPFMAAVAQGLAERGVASLRYQFPSMQAGARRPDPPRIAHRAVRAAVSAAGQLVPGIPLVAGGKSFGGRMTSQAQAESPLPGVCGLAFLGFPLHPAGRPSDDRAEHLGRVELPLLFLQGTRDALAEVERLRAVVGRLGERATLQLFDGADHSFHAPARSGRSDDQLLAEVLDALADWIGERSRATAAS